MGNIENSIKHLQSSIRLRSAKIKFWHEQSKWIRFRSLNPDLEKQKDFHKRKLMKYKSNIAILAHEQKTEKKMLAMMFLCKNALHNKKVVYPREMDIL